MAILLQYNFTGSVVTPTTQAANLTGGNMTGGSAVTSGTYVSEPNYQYPVLAGATNIAGAITANSYFYFTITPAAGYKLNLSTLTFNAARAANTSTRGYGVRSSKDTYATSLGTADVSAADPTWAAISIDVSSLTNISAALTFRIYSYAGLTGQAMDYDDITLNGTVIKAGGGIGIGSPMIF